jgi:hypothetical protein
VKLKNLFGNRNGNARLGAHTKTLLFLFALSLLVRLIFFLPVAISGVPPDYDETMYYNQATAFRTIMIDFLHGQAPEGETLGNAYGLGWWLPLHPALLGLGLLLFGKSVAVARLAGVLISAATTPLVYALTAKHAGDAKNKAAMSSALIHIFYPSFIAYSHYLWSETTFILLLLLAVFFAKRLVDTPPGRKRTASAAMAGLFLGLCGLTRAAALPFMAILPCWAAISLKQKRDRLLLPAMILVVSIVTIIPWECALYMNEGRFVLLSKSGGFGLHMGNNPWVPDEIGSSQGVAGNRHRDLIDDQVGDYMEENRVDRNAARIALAVREIRGDYPQFLRRCLYRLRMLWSNDNNILRHVLHGNYPPMPHLAAAAIWVLVIICHVVVIGLAAAGFLAPRAQFRHRSLLLILLLGGMGPPLLGIAVPRFHFPLLALMLPAAGVGCANLGATMKSASGAAAVAAALIVGGFSLATLPTKTSNLIQPSSYYRGLIDRVDSIFGSETSYADIMVFRVRKGVGSTGVLSINPLNRDSSFPPKRSGMSEWDTATKGAHRVIIHSRNLEGPLKIALLSKKTGNSVVIEPIKPDYWRQWQPTGLDGIYVRWYVAARMDQQ